MLPGLTPGRFVYIAGKQGIPGVHIIDYALSSIICPRSIVHGLSLLPHVEGILASPLEETGLNMCGFMPHCPSDFYERAARAVHPVLSSFRATDSEVSAEFNFVPKL